jgi:uncharacterized protein (DUF433 family)
LRSAGKNAYIGHMSLLDRITVEPGKMGARACIRGMRIRVIDVLDMLARGASQEQILADFPCLEAQDIRASIAYAAAQLGSSAVEVR